MPQPDGVVGASLRPLGTSQEDYRHIFLIKNNRSEDDFSPVMRMCAAFATPPPSFETEIRAAIDVDQWLRSFALMALAGAVDNYGDGAQHNVQMYGRSSDQRVLLFPHDLDFVGGPYGAVIGQYDLVLLLGLPNARRTFYQLLYDLSDFFSNPSLEHSANQLGALLGNQPFASHHAFFVERTRYIFEDAPDGILASAPPTEFAILTPDATRFPRGQVVIEGQGWLDIRAIDFNGISVLPDWTDTTRFEFRPNLSPGEHLLELEALDRNGQPIAQDDVIIFIE